MVSLAEPRKRQKWTMNPRGNLWSKDENKFGQKLLEKMGWKDGDGLGAQKQGMKDPVALKANQDNKGVGHKGGDDDVWLNHKDNFAEVLSALNSVHNSAENSEDSDTKEDVTSLSNASKKSKKRVHYEKRVKGKDCSTYSQTDLSCILGTEKRKKRKKKHEEDMKNVELEREVEETKVENDNEPKREIYGGSITDYFKQKMQALKERQAKQKLEALKSNSDEPQPETESNEVRMRKSFT